MPRDREIAQKAYSFVSSLPKGPETVFLLGLLKPRVKREWAAKVKEPVKKRGSDTKTVKAKLDRAFSTWIRRRDCFLEGGCGICITCGRPKHISDMDCGHFMSRGFLPTRWDPTNCAAQCRKCNRFQEGLHAEFARQLDLNIPGTSDRLMLKAKTGKAPMKFEMEKLLEHYEALNKIEARP